MATSCARSFIRSSTFRSAAAKVTPQAKAARSSASPFRLPKQTPLTNPIFRSPVELSCAMESLLPFHTATASALLTSMLSVTRPGLGWLPEVHRISVSEGDGEGKVGSRRGAGQGIRRRVKKRMWTEECGCEDGRRRVVPQNVNYALERRITSARITEMAN
ncbi:hypothetical protein IFM89_031740 [Coptis chinensis]|uniref:Protein NUCLEAR FUSION DEFECTIVE 6, chloroplastic/mitochondrial-like n=1 Tax=Coptis chinensis TaxID=261450 RepID=A0A835H065_9MAGN|nr:hypothetical protein IFM89_031740 [Coptis chinensis]